MVDADDLKYWLGLSLVEGFGPRIFHSCYAKLGSARAIWEAEYKVLSALGFSERAWGSLLRLRQAADLEGELGRLGSLGIKLLRLVDENYPRNLKEISSAPFLLYLRGDITPQDELSLAVVGTRKFTDYGRQVTTKIVTDLVANGLTIVSGLALGIDTVSHRAALSCGGRTIAVLAHGLDRIYPPENRELAEDIVRNGALVSEFPIGFPPVPGNFPARNRIIAGLSLGTLVCEAPEKSGALITASQTAEMGRPVYAVPGSVFSPQSMGTARLIQDGAKLILDTEDILSELNPQRKMLQLEAREIVPESEEEALILEVLREQALHSDEICRLTNLPAAVVFSTLTKMGIKGIVEEFLGGRWGIKR